LDGIKVGPKRLNFLGLVYLKGQDWKIIYFGSNTGGERIYIWNLKVGEIKFKSVSRGVYFNYLLLYSWFLLRVIIISRISFFNTKYRRVQFPWQGFFFNLKNSQIGQSGWASWVSKVVGFVRR